MKRLILLFALALPLAAQYTPPGGGGGGSTGLPVPSFSTPLTNASIIRVGGNSSELAQSTQTATGPGCGGSLFNFTSQPLVFADGLLRIAWQDNCGLWLMTCNNLACDNPITSLINSSDNVGDQGTLSVALNEDPTTHYARVASINDVNAAINYYACSGTAPCGTVTAHAIGGTYLPDSNLSMVVGPAPNHFPILVFADSHAAPTVIKTVLCAASCITSTMNAGVTPESNGWGISVVLAPDGFLSYSFTSTSEFSGGTGTSYLVHNNDLAGTAPTVKVIGSNSGRISAAPLTIGSDNVTRVLISNATGVALVTCGAAAYTCPTFSTQQITTHGEAPASGTIDSSNNIVAVLRAYSGDNTSPFLFLDSTGTINQINNIQADNILGGVALDSIGAAYVTYQQYGDTLTMCAHMLLPTGAYTLSPDLNPIGQYSLNTPKFYTENITFDGAPVSQAAVTWWIQNIGNSPFAITNCFNCPPTIPAGGSIPILWGADDPDVIYLWSAGADTNPQWPVLPAPDPKKPLNAVQSYFGSGRILLGVIHGANFNTTADQPISTHVAPVVGYPLGSALPVELGKYVVTDVWVTNATVSLTTAVGGVYVAQGKVTAIVANTQAYSALTASSKLLALTLNATASNTVRNEDTLYLSLTTPQGGAATADVYVFGEPLP